MTTIAEIRSKLRDSDDSHLIPLADSLTDDQIRLLREAFAEADTQDDGTEWWRENGWTA